MFLKNEFIKDVGFKYSFRNKQIIAQILSITKKGEFLTYEELKSAINAMHYYLSGLNGEDNFYDLKGDFKPITKENDFSGVFYKYISEEVYQNYISKGIFQLGSLAYYRNIERKESRDDREGMVNVVINADEAQVIIPVISGLDSYILCGTDDFSSQDYLTKNFGSRVMSVKNVVGFAEKLQNIIGADSWQISKVTYTDFKASMVNHSVHEIENLTPDLNEQVFDILYNAAEYASIFSKPTEFSLENELRLTFKMPHVINDSSIKFTDSSLLEYIEII